MNRRSFALGVAGVSATAALGTEAHAVDNPAAPNGPSAPGGSPTADRHGTFFHEQTLWDSVEGPLVNYHVHALETVAAPSPGVASASSSPRNRWAARPSSASRRPAPGANRAGNAPYTVVHADGTDTVRIDQRLPGTTEPRGGTWVSLGAYRLRAGLGTSVELSNDADGTVVADAVRLLGPRT